MIHLSTQHHLCVLQWLIVEQPVQLCPLCRGVAVLILDGDAVDGKSGAILEPGFYPVGVHIEAAGKQFCHNSILQDLILMAVTRTNAVKSLSDEVDFSLSGSKCTVSARF